MTKKLKVIFLTILSAVCAACAFAGCKVGREGREEVLKDYKAHVTYFANGGYFDGSTTLTVRDLYFKNDPSSEGYNEAGVPFFEITGDSNGMKVARTGYDLLGWYEPETYSEGEHKDEVIYTYDEANTIPVFPLYDEDGKQITDDEDDRPVFARVGVDEQIPENKVFVKPSDVPVTSQRRVADDETLVVCADWAPSLKMKYVLVCEDGVEFEAADGAKYKNGDTLRVDDFGDGEVASPTSLAPLALNGATFVRSYSDAELTQKVETLSRPEEIDENDPSVTVYSHYLAGEWTIVGNNATQLSGMFSNMYSYQDPKKFYIVEDIDCATMSNFSLSLVELAAQVGGGTVTDATIVGNGHKISNLKFSNSNVANRSAYSIFGNVSADFKVSDLTLENITIDLSGKGSLTTYALINSAESGATFENFKITGKIEANVSIPDDVSNARGGNRSNWLFGGEGSDAAFLEKFAGIEVTDDRTLTISSDEN